MKPWANSPKLERLCRSIHVLMLSNTIDRFFIEKKLSYLKLPSCTPVHLLSELGLVCLIYDLEETNIESNGGIKNSTNGCSLYF